MTSVTIPGSVEAIEEKAFEGCTSLPSIIIPDGTTTIGPRAFYGCSSLETISIPESVVSIGYQAFQGTPWYEKNKDGVPNVEVSRKTSDIIDMAGRSATQTTDIPSMNIIIIDGKKYLLK